MGRVVGGEAAGPRDGERERGALPVLLVLLRHSRAVGQQEGAEPPGSHTDS